MTTSEDGAASPATPREHGAQAADQANIARRLRSHAQWLQDERRSPLYVVLMRGAADDLDAGGIVATLFSGVDAPPGSVPQLRLMGALHELVLAGGAPELAAFYPSAGGEREPDGAWPVAERTLREHADWIAPRLRATVQTNEPGRSAVLYAALLWLTACHRRPIRLLEIGASAGVNLLADRYAYVQGDLRLGAGADAAVTFTDPWDPGPPIDLAAAAARLQIAARAGCDPSPRDPADPADRLRLLSYIWPDELARFRRLEAALRVAAADPPLVAAARAVDWLPDALARRRPNELTVVWHSVVRQYVAPPEWAATEALVARAAELHPGGPVVRVGMEPTRERTTGCVVTVSGTGVAGRRQLARCGDHGPPVRWGAETVGV